MTTESKTRQAGIETGMEKFAIQFRWRNGNKWMIRDSGEYFQDAESAIAEAAKRNERESYWDADNTAIEWRAVSRTVECGLFGVKYGAWTEIA